MTRDELLRILDFANTSRLLSEQRTHLAQTDARWNIIAYAMRRHLEGKLLTVSSAAAAAGVPYGTAMRRITELLEEGRLHKRPRSKSGRSFSLHPTRELIREFEAFALNLKAHVGKTFGFSQDDDAIGDFFFGGSYMTARILSFPNAMRVGVGYDQTIRVLGPLDPTFRTLKENIWTLNELCGCNFQFTLLPLDELHDELFNNSAARISKYDVVSFDLPWIGELSEKQIVMPLDQIIEDERYNASDFHTAAWKGSRYDRHQFGIPIQPTTELLFYRNDMFSEAGLEPPETLADVLAAARTLHKRKRDTSGIVMNFGRGLPVAHTFIQTMADFGTPVINLRKVGQDFDISSISRDEFRPMIDSEAGHRTADYLLSLLDYAHPESIKCDWDKRIRLFSDGLAAMTYGWSIRAAAFEINEKATAFGKVGFVSHPGGTAGHHVSPIGGFSLAIPANLEAGRIPNSWKVMEYLSRPEMMKWYVQNGNLTSPRFSTSADPEVQTFSPLIRFLDSMERSGETQIWPRPPVPEINEILDILGEGIHAMLRKETTPARALHECQQQVDRLMREHGRY